MEFPKLPSHWKDLSWLCWMAIPKKKQLKLYQEETVQCIALLLFFKPISLYRTQMTHIVEKPLNQLWACIDGMTITKIKSKYTYQNNFGALPTGCPSLAAVKRSLVSELDTIASYGFSKHSWYTHTVTLLPIRTNAVSWRRSMGFSWTNRINDLDTYFFYKFYWSRVTLPGKFLNQLWILIPKISKDYWPRGEFQWKDNAECCSVISRERTRSSILGALWRVQQFNFRFCGLGVFHNRDTLSVRHNLESTMSSVQDDLIIN